MYREPGLMAKAVGLRGARSQQTTTKASSIFPSRCPRRPSQTKGDEGRGRKEAEADKAGDTRLIPSTRRRYNQQSWPLRPCAIHHGPSTSRCQVGPHRGAGPDRAMQAGAAQSGRVAPPVAGSHGVRTLHASRTPPITQLRSCHPGISQHVTT